MFNNFFKTLSENKFKACMILVFIYPIIPLALLASGMWIVGGWDILNKGIKYSSVSQVIYQFLLFSGGTSGLIGGLMVIFNRVNSWSAMLFLHGAISYSFVAVLILSGTVWTSIWSLHGIYIAAGLVVIAIQLFLIFKQLLADKGWRKPDIELVS